MLFGLHSGESLIVHLRMTGELRIHAPAASVPAAVPVDKHTHVLFELDTGEELRFRDTRKFGRIWLVEDVSEVVGKLGPEPLSEEYIPNTLAQALEGRKANIKALLLNQTVVAGVGNIYADESLFHAGIDPRRPGGGLVIDEITRLHHALRNVLLAGSRRRAVLYRTMPRRPAAKAVFRSSSRFSAAPASRAFAAVPQ